MTLHAILPVNSVTSSTAILRSSRCITACISHHAMQPTQHFISHCAMQPTQRFISHRAMQPTQHFISHKAVKLPLIFKSLNGSSPLCAKNITRNIKDIR